MQSSVYGCNCNILCQRARNSSQIAFTRYCSTIRVTKTLQVSIYILCRDRWEGLASWASCAASSQAPTVEQQPRPVQRVAGDLAVFTGLSSEKAHQGTVSVSVQISSATTTNLCYDCVVDIVADSNVGSASAVISICVGCWGLPLAAFHVLRVFVSCL